MHHLLQFLLFLKTPNRLSVLCLPFLAKAAWTIPAADLFQRC
ncbi:hypothetical protein ATN83_1129 [Raoultella ornithinolytica]|nr:hypothetical protein ATN83_1129 [Raoultella ornithinolytica]